MEKILESPKKSSAIEELEGLDRDLDFKRNFEQAMERIYFLVKNIFLENGYTLQPDVNIEEAFRKIKKEKLKGDDEFFVRMEDLKEIIEALVKKNSLVVAPILDQTTKSIQGDNYKYNNCVQVFGNNLSEALSNCYKEGQNLSLGTPTIIGFKGSRKNLSHSAVAKGVSKDIFYAYDCSYTGEVPFEDIEFIRLRIPAKVFPKKKLTQTDQEFIEAMRRKHKSEFVYRDFYLKQ